MNQADILIKNAYLITMNDARDVIPDGCIAVKGDRILAVGTSSLLEQYSAPQVVDAVGKFVFPGMISTHSHLFQTLLKGLGRDKHLLDWLNSSVRVALHNYDEECVYYAALTGCIEAVRSGTTTILDYMYCHSMPGLDDQVTRAFEEIGIRGVLGRAFTNVAAFPPEIGCSYVETERHFFDDVRRLEKQYRNHSRIGVAMAPGIIWDHTDDGFREMRRTADELHIPITLHLVETPDDDEFSMKVHRERTIPHLEKLGVLGPDFLAVHCVYMMDEDFETFRRHDVKIGHCPVSNMILASGVAPVPRFLEKGLTVSLACDGSASNDSQNMLEVLKSAALLQKVHTLDASAMPASTILEMATLGGARALGMEQDLGGLTPGKKADLLIYQPRSPWSVPLHDPVSALVYASTPENVESVMVDGKWILEKGAVTTVDEEKVLWETQRVAEKLIGRSGLGNSQWGKKLPVPALGARREGAGR